MTILLQKARQRAKAKGLGFNITKSDIVVPDHCPVLGIPLFRMKGQAHPGSPSLDRINNDLGYVRGNVRVISYRANSLKSNATLHEMEAVVRDIRSAMPFTPIPAAHIVPPLTA